MLAFTTDEFAAVFRNEVDDPLEGVDASSPDSECLWKNAEIYRYMTSAADAVARAVEGIYKIVEITLVANQQAYTLPRNVLHIREARLVTADRRLRPSNADVATRMRGDDYGELLNNQFWSATGVPSCYVRDYRKNALLLSPIPTTADTLELQCTATVATPLAAAMPMPFMEVPDQELMLLYMCHLAYRKQDADVLDLKQSREYKTMFEEAATMRKELLESYRRTPGLVETWWNDGSY